MTFCTILYINLSFQLGALKTNVDYSGYQGKVELDLVKGKYQMNVQ